MIRLIAAIFKKELKDHVRDRRALLSAFMFPLIGTVITAVLFGLIASWQRSDRPLHIAVVGRDRAPSVMAFLERHGAVLSDAPKDHEKRVRDDDEDVVIVVSEDFAKDFRAGHSAKIEVEIDGSNNKSHAVVRRTEGLLRAYGGEIGALRLLARGVSPELAAPMAIAEVDLATKQQQSASLFNMIPLFLLMAAFMGGMHVAIDSMAGERERGSLEPLLVNPVPPLSLVVGKWLATVVAALVSELAMLGGMAIAIRRTPLEDLGLRASFGAREAGLLLAALVPLVLFTGALELLVATFARTFKEAQTYVTIVMFVPILPEMVLSFSPFKPQAWMSWVPTLAQEMLMTDVMRGDPIATLSWVAAAAGTVIAAAALLVVTARLVVKEKIVFGR